MFGLSVKFTPQSIRLIMKSLPSLRPLSSRANLTTVPVASHTSKHKSTRTQSSGKIGPIGTDPHVSKVDSLNVTDTKLPKIEFTCHFIDCNLKFNHCSSLTRHLRIHNETLSCTVNGCEKVFVYEKDLKRHLIRHSQPFSIIIKFRKQTTKSIAANNPNDYCQTETGSNVKLDFIESCNTKTDTVKKIEVDANHSNSVKVMSNRNLHNTTSRKQSNGWRKLIRKFIVLRKNLLSKDIARKNPQKKQKMNAQDRQNQIEPQNLVSSSSETTVSIKSLNTGLIEQSQLQENMNGRSLFVPNDTTETVSNIQSDIIESCNTKTDTIRTMQVEENHSNSETVMFNRIINATTSKERLNGWRRLIRNRMRISLSKNRFSKKISRNNRQKKQNANTQDSSQKFQTYSEGIKRSSESAQDDQQPYGQVNNVIDTQQDWDELEIVEKGDGETNEKVEENQVEVKDQVNLKTHLQFDDETSDKEEVEIEEEEDEEIDNEETEIDSDNCEEYENNQDEESSRFVANPPIDTTLTSNPSPVIIQSAKLPKRKHAEKGLRRVQNNRDNQKDTKDDEGEVTFQSVKRSRLTTLSSTKHTQIIAHTLQCPQCGLMFAKEEFNDHLKKQHSIDPNRCLVKDCRQSFDNWILLGQHRMQSHQSTTQWHCDKCDRHFPSYRRLSSHDMQIHQISKFSCVLIYD